MPRSPRSILLAAGFLLGSLGCATTRSARTGLLVVDLEGHELTVEGVTDTFARAVTAYHAGRYDEALSLFALLAEGAPPSTSFARYSAFDAGMAALHLDRPTEAAAQFSRVVASGDPELVMEARYRLAQAEEGAGRVPEALRLLEGLSGGPRLPRGLREEATLRAAVLRLETRSGSPDEVAALAGRAVEPSAGSGRAAAAMDPELAPRALFDVGASDLAACAAVDLAHPLPPRALENALERKAELLLEAQRWLLKTIRMSGSARWAARSLATLAEAYRDFHAALLEAPIPSDLSAEERQVYVEELKGAIAPLLDRAAWIDGRNVQMASRVGLLDQWVELSRAHLNHEGAPPPEAAPAGRLN